MALDERWNIFMETVLVTGGCGFIGSHIVDLLLEKGYKVAVVDNLSSGKLENINLDHVDFYNLDISSGEVINLIGEISPKYIIHQAAQVSVAASINNISRDAQINIQGSVNLIDAAIKHDVKKIIFASSAAIYGTPEYIPVDLKHNKKPISPYGLSKYTVEQYLELAKLQYGLDYTVLRYSNVYGPRQDASGEGGVVSIFADKLIMDQEVFIYGDGEQTRDFVYVKDVACANLLALTEGDNLVLNVSTEYEESINQLFNRIKSITRSQRTPTHIDTRAGDIRNSVLSNNETREALCWEPLYKLDKGIKELINYEITQTKSYVKSML